MLFYPPPDNESFGNYTKAAKTATTALAATTVAGAPVRVSGIDAVNNQTSGGSGPGVLLESTLGGLGALVVVAFVFSSLLAFVPLLMAIVSIMTTFLVLGGVSTITDVSMIVEYLVALIGLGVAIDYSLLDVNTLANKGSAHSGLVALERSRIGDGALEPIEVLSPFHRTAVVRGIGRTGRLVTSAALILFLAFVALASSPETDTKVFATGLAAGILLDATVIRALLVPAGVSLFGRWNWWLPTPPARLPRVEPSLPAASSEPAPG